MPQAQAFTVPAAGATLESTEREVTEPGRGEARIRIEACGVCHSDSMTFNGFAASYPRIPGHEIAGVIDALGDGVEHWEVGQRVGVGWYGGACFNCDPCRRGDHIDCQKLRTPGLTDDGGYAHFATFPIDALAAIPDALTAVEAAPLMCAGVTTFNGLRMTQARAGEVVAILGLGGLGHLGVQFAAKMGYETVAIARGQDKASFATELGAHHYIDSTSQDVAAELTKLGGASVVLSTITDAAATTVTVGGLRARGELVVVGVPHDPLSLSVVPLVMASRSVAGHPSGTAKDSEDTLRFAALSGVRPMIETMPLEDASKAYERMMSGAARFRVVLTM